MSTTSMTNYFPMKWSSMLRLSSFVEDSTSPTHSGSDKNALEMLKQKSKNMLKNAVPRLCEEDPFRCLLAEQSHLRDDILLRLLHFNELNVSKSIRQLEATLDWRARGRICAVDLGVTQGTQSGIPIARLCEPTENGDSLFYASAGLYDKAVVDRDVQKIGVARMFEHMLYDSNGPRAKRGTVVVDFTGFGTKNVDVNGLRVGVTTYMNHYPEVFDKIFLTHYPRILYGVWRAVAPLLDKGTARRVVWVESKEQLREALMERYSEKNIPSWLGGEADVPSVRLLNGSEVSSELLAQRFF